jgi:hypothetical protein
MFVFAPALANLGATGNMNGYMGIPSVLVGDEHNPSLRQAAER